jgi:hypothetical protein
MVNEQNLIPKTETVYELKNEVEKFRVPMLSEIIDENGKVKLPPEYVEKLRDPNARFGVDLTVCLVGIEEWEDLYVACMSTGCSDTTLGYWRHGNCSYSYPDRIKWSTHANLKCPSCGEISDIGKWKFICHGSGCTQTTTDLDKLTKVVIMALDYEDVNKDFARLFLRNAQEVLRK